MKSLYNEDYYERGVEAGVSGYSNYRWIPELTIPMCARMVEDLPIRDWETVLDFGCAKGFVVKALRLLRKQAWGYDNSDYAIDNCDPSVREFLSREIPQGPFDWILAKDVLEHVGYPEIDSLLKRLSTIGRRLFAVIPLGENGRYIVPSYEMDVTHKIREPLNWWQEKIHSAGYQVTYASYCFSFLKENYSKWPQGNGFIVAKTEDSP